MRKHRLAMFGFTVLIIMYILSIFSEFFSVNDAREYHEKYIFVPPQGIHFVDNDGNFHFKPFVFFPQDLQCIENPSVSYLDVFEY